MQTVCQWIVLLVFLAVPVFQCCFQFFLPDEPEVEVSVSGKAVIVIWVAVLLTIWGAGGLPF